MADQQNSVPPPGGNAGWRPPVPPRPYPVAPPIPPRPQQPVQPAPFVQPQLPVRGRGHHRGGDNHHDRGSWGCQRGHGHGRNTQGQGRNRQNRGGRFQGQDVQNQGQQDQGQQGVSAAPVQAPAAPVMQAPYWAQPAPPAAASLAPEPQAAYGQYLGPAQANPYTPASPYEIQWQPPPLRHYPPSPYLAPPAQGPPPTTYQSPQPAWWSDPFATPPWARPAPATAPPPAATPSDRGHSYRVQKPKSRSNQRAADYQKRQSDAAAKRLETMEAVLRAREEEKAKALDKETRDREIEEKVGPLQARLDTMDAEKALKKKKKEAKRAAQERSAEMEQVVSERLAPVQTELSQLRQQREDRVERERQRAAAEEGRRRKVEAEAEEKEKEKRARDEQRTQTQTQIRQLGDLFNRVMERRMQHAVAAQMATTMVGPSVPLAASYHTTWTAYIALLSTARTTIQAGFANANARLLFLGEDAIPAFFNVVLAAARQVVEGYEENWATVIAQHQQQRHQAFPGATLFPAQMQLPAGLLMLEEGVNHEMQLQQQDQYQLQQQQQQVGPAFQQQTPFQHNIPSYALPTPGQGQQILQNFTGPNYFIIQGHEGLGMQNQLSVPAETEGVEQSGTTGTGGGRVLEGDDEEEL